MSDVKDISTLQSLPSVSDVLGFKGDSLGRISADTLRKQGTSSEFMHKNANGATNTWIRVATIDNTTNSFAGLFTIYGFWHTGSPSSCVLAIAISAGSDGYAIDAKPIVGHTRYNSTKLRVVGTNGKVYLDILHSSTDNTKIFIDMMPYSPLVILHHSPQVADSIPADAKVVELNWGGVNRYPSINCNPTAKGGGLRDGGSERVNLRDSQGAAPKSTVYRHASFQGSLDDALSGGVYDYSSGSTTDIPDRVYAYGTLEVMEGYSFITQRLIPHQVRNNIAMASRVWYRNEAKWQPWVFFTGVVQSS